MASRPLKSESPRARGRWLVILLVVAGGAAPLAVYGILFGRVPTLTPGAARLRLSALDRAAVLVDVRPAPVYESGHLAGATNWPWPEILAVESPSDVPPALRGKTLLLVCDVGLVSRRATWHLQGVGISPVLNVRGGIQEWVRSFANAQPRRRPPPDGNLRAWLEQGSAPEGREYDRWQTPTGIVGLPFRLSPVGEQVAAVVAYFVVKPTYMALSLALAAALVRRRDADLTAVRWGMLAFFLGEAACAVNYFVFRETSYLSEYLHCLGMLLCFSFVTYALLEGFDRRILMLSDPHRRCAALALCSTCIKYSDVPCGLKRMFLLIVPSLLVVSFMLPTADWQDTSYNTVVFGQVYNYAHLRVHQLFENVYCATAASAMFVASLIVLLSKAQASIAMAKITFAAGVGPLGFGLLRMVLAGAYDENRVWYLFWEEMTELVFIVAVSVVLWIFRGTLFAARANSAATGGAGPTPSAGFDS